MNNPKRERVHSVLWPKNQAMSREAAHRKSPIGKNRYESNGFFNTNNAFDRIVSLILPRR